MTSPGTTPDPTPDPAPDPAPELTLAGLLADAGRVVAFTGAGISTESGIPDFRSTDGVCTRYDPSDFFSARSSPQI